MRESKKPIAYYFGKKIIGGVKYSPQGEYKNLSEDIEIYNMVVMKKRKDVGIDIVKIKTGKSMESHVHEGQHFLQCVDGSGELIYDGIEYPLYPGIGYEIESNIVHGVNASSNAGPLILQTTSNDYKDPESGERLGPVN